MSDSANPCKHPEGMVRHKARGIYVCMNCGHESHLIDRPYFCNKCHDVHSLTHAEYILHKKQAHGEDWAYKSKRQLADEKSAAEDAKAPVTAGTA